MILAAHIFADWLLLSFIACEIWALAMGDL